MWDFTSSSYHCFYCKHALLVQLLSGHGMVIANWTLDRHRKGTHNVKVFVEEGLDFSTKSDGSSLGYNRHHKRTHFRARDIPVYWADKVGTSMAIRRKIHKRHRRRRTKSFYIFTLKGKDSRVTLLKFIDGQSWDSRNKWNRTKGRHNSLRRRNKGVLLVVWQRSRARRIRARRSCSIITNVGSSKSIGRDAEAKNSFLISRNIDGDWSRRRGHKQGSSRNKHWRIRISRMRRVWLVSWGLHWDGWMLNWSG